MKLTINVIMMLLLFVCSATISAQTNEKGYMVAGTVMDEKGETIIGASITVDKDRSKGTATDLDGKFRLQGLSKGEVLTVTFIGYKPYSYKVTMSKENIKIVLEPQVSDLDEVVIVGEGSQKKISLTGAVTTIEPAALDVPATSVSNMLGGNVPGIIAVTRSGEPGSDFSEFWVRGIGTFGANSSALILIDGVEGDMNQLDPADIESFSVLKDASATAIYGSRASNGVIIITTKKGNTDGVSRPSFSYSANVTVGNVYKKLDVLSASEYREAFAKYANAPEAFKLGDVNTDWQDEIYRVAMGTDHNLSMTGALKNMPYRVSVGYTNQNGTLKNNNYQRLNASIGLSPKFFDKHLSVDINIKGSIEDEKPVSTSVIGSAVGFDPTRPVYQNYDGNVGLGYYMWMGVSNTPHHASCLKPRLRLGTCRQAEQDQTLHR